MSRADGFGDHPLLLVDNQFENKQNGIVTSKKSNHVNAQADNEFRSNMLEQMKKFRPSNTIFETGNSSKNEVMSQMMSQKRAKHSELILKYKQKRDNKNSALAEEEIEDRNSNIDDVDMSESKPTSEKILEESSQHDIESTFGNNIVQPKAIKNAKVFVSKKQKLKSNSSKVKASKISTEKDKENYIGYHPKDHHTEAG